MPQESRLKQRQDEVLKQAFVNCKVKPSDIKEDLGRLWFSVLTEQERSAILSIAQVPCESLEDLTRVRHLYSMRASDREKVERSIGVLSEKLACIAYQLRALKICESYHV